MEQLDLLLVEDDEDDCILIRRLLGNIPFSHYKVDWAPNYDACIDAISGRVYDICLLDYKLGTRSGLELLPEIFERHPSLPVIVLTGYGDYELDLQAMRAGAVDYLPKGQVSPDLLERSIRYAMERKRVERELSDYREHLEGLVAERTEELEELLKTVRRNEALLQRVLDALPVGVWITDQDGCIVHTNPAGEQTWGGFKNVCVENLDQLKGWWLETGKPVEAREWPISRAILNKETSLDNEIEIECFDGTRKILLNSAVPISDDHQGISGAIVVSQDITAQKRAERQICYITRRLLKGQDSERQKLSHDLHEVIGQDLSALKIGMDSIVDELPEPATQMKDRVVELSQMLQESIMALRDLSYTLRPATLDQLGLVRAIEHYCEEFSKRSGVQVDLFTAGVEDLRLDYHTCLTLYRLLHESLSNVRKYAGAKTVRVRLVASYPKIILSIKDDGKGFSMKDLLSSPSNERCMGLRIMEERTALLHGQMKVESSPDQGAMIRFEVPQEA